MQIEKTLGVSGPRARSLKVRRRPRRRDTSSCAPDIKSTHLSQYSEREIDLIVMSSGRRPLRAPILGSTAGQVCHTAVCSLFISHPNDHDCVASTGHIKLLRMLVAYDLSFDMMVAPRNRANSPEEEAGDLRVAEGVRSVAAKIGRDW